MHDTMIVFQYPVLSYFAKDIFKTFPCTCKSVNSKIIKDISLDVWKLATCIAINTTSHVLVILYISRTLVKSA